MEESEWRVLTNRGPLEELMATLQHSCHREPHGQYEKAKRYNVRRWVLQVRRSNMLLENSRGQLLTAPERMKRLGQSRGDSQLWMCLVVKVKSDAVKNNIP